MRCAPRAVAAACVFLMTAVTACSRGPEGAQAEARTPLYYRNPMDPSVTSPTPAKDSMGMDYVPVYANASPHANDRGVHVSAAVQQSLGVRTVAVQSAVWVVEHRGQGAIQFDEREIRDVRVRAEGFLEVLDVRAQGETVRKGQLLFQLYSPRLEVAEQELLGSLQFNDESRIQLATDRLRDLGIEPEFIAKLRETRKIPHLIPFHAQSAGVVTTLRVRQGAMVSGDTLIMQLADISRVWVIGQLPQRAAGTVRVGDSATIAVDAYPGRTFEGRVTYIYPELDDATRALKVRIDVPNDDATLKANMYAAVTVRNAATDAVLQVPASAVIRDARGARVMLAQGEGRFVPARVTIGAEAGNVVSIVGGLAAGDRVAASAVFLLDSEATLNAGLARYESAPAVSERAPAAGADVSH
jgi:Cu(I)/Ag(I) efflux system membrane fusion protein